MPSAESLKKLLDEFEEKEALINAEAKVIDEQICELEKRLEECRRRLSVVAEDRRRILAMKECYGLGIDAIPAAPLTDEQLRSIESTGFARPGSNGALAVARARRQEHRRLTEPPTEETGDVSGHPQRSISGLASRQQEAAQAEPGPVAAGAEATADSTGEETVEAAAHPRQPAAAQDNFPEAVTYPIKPGAGRRSRQSQTTSGEPPAGAGDSQTQAGSQAVQKTPDALTPGMQIYQLPAPGETAGAEQGAQSNACAPPSGFPSVSPMPGHQSAEQDPPPVRAVDVTGQTVPSGADQPPTPSAAAGNEQSAPDFMTTTADTQISPAAPALPAGDLEQPSVKLDQGGAGISSLLRKTLTGMEPPGSAPENPVMNSWNASQSSPATAETTSLGQEAAVQDSGAASKGADAASGTTGSDTTPADDSGIVDLNSAEGGDGEEVDSDTVKSINAALRSLFS